MTILDKIVERKKVEVKEQKSKVPLNSLEMHLGDAPVVNSLHDSLSRDGIRVIAECKMASPSKGVIRENYQPVDIALSYEEHGAAAISCLTDREFFQGSLDDLKAVRERVSIPVLRKEFIIDEYQIFEARNCGADAVLLICSILDRFQMRDYIALIRELKMDALVEMYDLNEIEMAVENNTGIVGINNRDLRNFEVDLGHTAKVAAEIPDDLILVSESGIYTSGDVETVAESGTKAILVGEAFMRQPDPGKALGELMKPFEISSQS